MIEIRVQLGQEQLLSHLRPRYIVDLLWVHAPVASQRDIAILIVGSRTNLIMGSRYNMHLAPVGCDGYCRTAEAVVLETGILLVGQLTRP
jgi:hypothetical protein